MSLQVYPPINIVNIIISELFPNRNFTLINSDGFSDDEIISDMEKYGFVRIDGVNNNPRGLRNKIVFIIMKSNDNYSGNNLELRKVKKLIEMIDNDDITKNKTLDEFFLVVNKEYFGRKNFDDIVKDLYNKQKGGVDPEGEYPYYSIFPYHNFSFSVPKCKILFPHILMSKEEVNDLIQKERINFRDLPIILTNDINIIWNGGRPGQVVRIHRYSESALESIYYRRIESHIK
jgi:DNA-directed RNA polymerase subunit H (RpoH/RPB5)